ncbi:DUF192 domain-containing protein [Candidatus Microgenomates bacterium]|jgi:hypothetical protein|nr:MAG: DUF192 domain-containing protein [Candidatus Microgenomates bacterium]
MAKLRIIIFGLVFLIIGLIFFNHKTEGKNYISINGKKIEVEIADTSSLRQQGLSERKSLCPDCGMLFLFPEPGFYGFWMRKMHFDIDIIWVRGETIVDIAKSVSRPGPHEFESPRKTYTSREPADKVIEVNSGWCEANGIEIGDRVSY